MSRAAKLTWIWDPNKIAAHIKCLKTLHVSHPSSPGHQIQGASAFITELIVIEMGINRYNIWIMTACSSCIRDLVAGQHRKIILLACWKIQYSNALPHSLKLNDLREGRLLCYKVHRLQRSVTCCKEAAWHDLFYTLLFFFLYENFAVRLLTISEHWRSPWYPIRAC